MASRIFPSAPLAIEAPACTQPIPRTPGHLRPLVEGNHVRRRTFPGDPVREHFPTVSKFEPFGFVLCIPSSGGLRSARNLVVPVTLVRSTRGYIERITNQVNGAYENGWCDGCAVMIRRLMEN